MPQRSPAIAGQFYPASPRQCRAEVSQYLSAATTGELQEGPPPIAGIVPHAGWMCSGAVAADVIRTVGQDPAIETFVVFGAIHRVRGSQASVDPAGSWVTPLGEIAIDEELARVVLNASDLLIDDPRSHIPEHSIEVQVPFIQAVCGSARLLPILVPPVEQAAEVGLAVAEQAQAMGRRAVFLGSTDLTHYGPRYSFTPKGAGKDGLTWAREVNDRRMIDLCLKLAAEEVVHEANRNHNACGGGAVAAALAAARQCSATKARLCCHTTSAEVLHERLGPMTDSVGYAGIVFSPPSAD
ncbi:MAG TPA: AmmeMemoRadiSam system protein B [Phycisphaerae bacterium]|nr:AmmeMemoRadiSam system protein B [Phycisphaerae bacterium]